VAIQFVHRFFKGRNQGRGQALYSSISFGLGGALGSLYSGYMWDSVGPEATYLTASALSFIAVLLAWRWLIGK
jgi:PPP family 3-phenylpropionic acid transporter